MQVTVALLARVAGGPRPAAPGRDTDWPEWPPRTRRLALRQSPARARAAAIKALSCGSALHGPPAGPMRFEV